MKLSIDTFSNSRRQGFNWYKGPDSSSCCTNVDESCSQLVKLFKPPWRDPQHDLGVRTWSQTPSPPPQQSEFTRPRKDESPASMPSNPHRDGPAPVSTEYVRLVFYSRIPRCHRAFAGSSTRRDQENHDVHGTSGFDSMPS